MLPPNTYKVDDFETIRQTIFDDAYNALSKRFPLENDKYRLVVEDLGYDNIPKYTKLQQKEAIQSDKTLSAKLRGRWVLYDKATGKAVSRSPRKTIMDVPYMTERGTFIRNGTEMTLPIQMRLVPGVYTRVADNGEARAHINVRPGTGSQLSITMNPANPVFKVTQGTRNYKLYPLLKHMGISDEYLISAWGKDIYKANYDDFISGGGWYSAKTAAEENPYNEITKRVFRGELDPLETETALGKPFKTVDPDMMVAAATKLLKVIRGEAEPDNRDSLENQRFFMAPDLISERVRLDAGKVGQTLLWKLSRSGDVNKIPAGALNKYINGLFTESRLAQAIEETNPLDAYMRATKVTRMGEGGISGVETAPMSARLVQNTYKGFIDPTVSPECCANHLVMSNLGWVEIYKVTEDTLVACLIDGKLEYHKPYKVVSYDFNGELYCYSKQDISYEVTGNHRMWSRQKDSKEYTFEFAENIFNTNRIFWSGADTYTDDSKVEIEIFTNTPTEAFHFKKPYVGKVYCLSVPGGLFYTKLPGKRPFWIGNSLRAGLDSAIALNSVKGKDGFMYTPMINSISGKREYVNSLVASKSPVAFSEYRNSPQKYIPAMIGNKIEYMPKSQVKYFIPNGDSLFALSSNLIPLKSGIKAGRLLMAQKHQTQAVSLTHRMAPYVQTVHPGDEKVSVESSIGKLMGAVFSKGDGKVISVTPDEMTVRYMDGTKETISLYNNHPLNRKTLISNEVRVKPGDIVKKGQVLASSNYTDENGVSALGTQLRTAWLPFKGDNYLDAIIVSEDAAKKLTSEHFYHTGVDKDSGTTIGKNAYVAAFPTKFNKDQLATIDKDGLVKPGTMVKFGDPLILSYTKRDATPGSLHRALVKDGVVKWEHEFPGYVTDVVNSSKGVKVYTKAYLPLQTGDKLAARFANKGVTAKVVPTSEMPIAADGKPIDVIFGPTGIVSRVNSAQIVEAMLGKVAAKTGKRYVLPGFMDENMVEFAKRELANAGLTDREDITDPTTGIVIPQVTVGNSYIVKMHHTAESKGGARATGSYTIDDLPGGSGHNSAKTLGNLVLGALIGHGCFVGSTNILTDRGYMEIGNIVKRRLPINVYSYNKETDSFEYRPVTNWFVYTVDDSEMWEIHTTARSGIESAKGRGIAGSHRAIHCTKDHKFYTLDRGLVEASKLVEGDTVLTIGDSITEWQKQIIYGTLMGDGYSLRGTLRITHGPKQLSYNEWLYSKLKTFCNSSPIIKEQKSGFGKSVQSRLVTRSVGWISQIANEFYHTNKKTVPSDIITKMGWPGIGIWFADDGSCDNHKGKTHSYNFHTCAFTIQECELLISALNEFTGLIWSLVLKSGKYPIIRLNTRSIRDDQLSKFAKMIAPYLPPGFEYKLGDRYTSDLNYGLFWVDKVPFDHIDKPEVCFVKKSAPYIRPDYDTSLVYDITVEHNHNFIAAGVLVSNSTEILKDMKLVKGQKNTDFWRDFKLGRTPVMPSTPLIYERFLASLQGAGINVHKEKNTTNIFALTNSDINDFAKAEVKNSDTYSSQNMQPMPGGLFDPNIFGPDGTQWGYIKLDEPLLNPIMEDPIKLILGLTEADLEAVISGNKKLPNGLTGGIGLKKQLESINMKQAVQDALNDIKTATKTRRDKAVKKYRYLQSMANHGVSPTDFMLDKVPVIPPRFRRITQSGDLTMVADANYLYRALMNNQQDVRDARNIGLPDDIVGSGNLKIYKAFKAITGISDPEDRKLQEKQVSGLLKWVFGKGSPKCYDSETEILTENGWVKFPEYLDSTIKVATLNPSTDAFEWQTPTDIIHIPYSGDMIYTHTRYLDSMVTPNHNHYVSLRIGRGINSRWTSFTKEQASNLVDVVKRVRYKTAASKYIGSTPNTFDITPNANAFATFIGWYAAEGWIHTDNTIAYIAVKAHGRDESILTDLLDNNSFKYKKAYYTTKAAKVSPYGIKTPAGYEMVYFSFYSKELCQWLKDNVGASCYTKHLSSEILGWSSEYLINVWEGFHAGDGEKRSGLITANTKKTWQSRKSFTDRGNRAYTVSKDLAESFVELGLKVGASVNYVKNKEVYRISVHAFDYSLAEYRHQTSKVPYDGMVHCVTVPNGLVFVRRNGKVLVSGNSGAYQRNVVGGTLDVAGRNVITTNSALRLDEVGLPEKEAWTLYQDFVIRRLVQNGMDPLVATKEVTNRTKLAEDALKQVVNERPVLLTRAPALHKYSIMAFRPRLVKGETIQLSPPIEKPFNADFDGDFQVSRVIVRFKRNIDVPFKYRLDF